MTTLLENEKILETTTITNFSLYINLQSIKILNCENITLEKLIPIKDLKNLLSFEIHNCKLNIKDIIETLPKSIEYLYIENCFIDDILLDFPRLKSITLKNTQLSVFPNLNSCGYLEYIDFSNNLLTNVNFIPAKTTILNLSRNYIKEIPNLYYVTNLNLNYNLLSNLPLLPELINLEISNNLLSNINNIAKSKHLKFINVQFNKIKDFNCLNKFDKFNKI